MDQQNHSQGQGEHSLVGNHCGEAVEGKVTEQLSPTHIRGIDSGVHNVIHQI